MEAATGPSSPSTPSRKDISPRKVRSEQVRGARIDKAPAKRQYSLTDFSNKVGEKFRSWMPRRSQRLAMGATHGVPSVGNGVNDIQASPTETSHSFDLGKPGLIPEGLSADEKLIYKSLLKVVKDREDHMEHDGKDTPSVVAITDLAKDYDDLAALVVLKELHRIGVIRLVGLVANLNPSQKRAIFGRGALNSLQLLGVPIARGTTGYTKTAYQGPDIKGRAGTKQHKELEHEFKGYDDSRGMEEFPVDNVNDDILTKEGAGEDLLKKLFCEAADSGRKLTLLLISSLEDIYTFLRSEPDILKGGVKNIVLQGGYSIKDDKLIPASDANNNRYDMKAAEKFHAWMKENQIPSAVYTKVAAFATPLYTDLFIELEKTGHPLGKHLRMVQVEQDLAFYIAACEKDPKKRFADYMDQEWFLKFKTSWFDNLDPDSPSYLPSDHPLYHAPDAPFPELRAVIPYLDKVVVYDALAALGTAGTDALDELQVLTDGNSQPSKIHRIVGFAGPPPDTGIHPKRMATALSALLKGSLLDSQSRRKSSVEMGS